jgi:hypothetical protein
MNLIGLPKFLKDHVEIEKRQSPYSPDKLSHLLILQNILGYDRIETSRPLDQDGIMKDLSAKIHQNWKVMNVK